MNWITDFKERIEDFEDGLPPAGNEIPVSIKVRVENGCYCRSCCPNAHRIIQSQLHHLASHHERLQYIEHESGPEIISYIAAGVGLLSSVITLVTVILQARKQGHEHGDKRHEPLTIVVRRLEEGDKLIEERIVSFDQHDEITEEIVRRALEIGVRKVLPNKPTKPKKTSKKRKAK